MEFSFSAEVWEWRGPAPFYFMSVPENANNKIAKQASAISYGWGAIPVTFTIAGREWTTSIFPKDGTYVVPLKAAVRAHNSIELGSTVKISIKIN